MNAQEARELLESRKKDLQYIINGIEIMAKDGNDFWCGESKKLKDPTAYAKELEELGFKVEMSESYFRVTW